MSPTTMLGTLRIPAKPAGLWTLVQASVAGPLLTIEANAKQTWSYADSQGAHCSADGDPDAQLSRENCLLPAAPVGALIGKIGGSTAGAADDGKPFVAGVYCVVAVPDGGGPLFLTINDEYAGMGNNAGFIDVTVTESPRATPAPAPVPCALPAILAKLAGCTPETKPDDADRAHGCALGSDSVNTDPRGSRGA